MAPCHDMLLDHLMVFQGAVDETDRELPPSSTVQGDEISYPRSMPVVACSLSLNGSGELQNRQCSDLILSELFAL
eukprot:scaffold20591_cov185-Skeletonema_menzelii.AAC.3